MSHQYSKNQVSGESELIVSGFDGGIAASPYKGIANMQGVNISTETGEAMCSFNRVQQAQVGTTGVITQVNTNTVSVSGITLLPGSVVTITSESGTGLIPALPTLNYLVVGGGGGGASTNNPTVPSGGGGGAGAVIPGTVTAAVQSYSVTVGTGGTGGTGGAGLSGTSGGSSSFGSVATALGGGGGGKSNTNGLNGGSGGGGGANGSTGGTGSTGGNAGGGAVAGGNNTGAGGGGASAAGGAGIANQGGNGGAGLASTITGTSVTYGGGGGGGAQSASGVAGTGGSGGGGGGSTTGTPGSGTNGLGGGGGGVGTPAANSAAGGTGGSGVVVISYPTGTIIATGGSITASGGNTIHTFTSSGTFTVSSQKVYMYYYLGGGRLFAGSLPPNDPDNATVVTGITSGTANFSITYPLASPIQSATESYFDSSNVEQYRYYILDASGTVWCHDTSQLVSYPTPSWFVVGSVGAGASGLANYNGWVTVSNGNITYWKLTSLLGNAFVTSPFTFESNKIHAMLSGHQGRLYGTDGTTITSLFANTSLVTGAANVQSYAQYSAVTTNCTIVAQTSGSVPTTGNFSPRIPVVFYTNGTLPTSIAAGHIYYIQWINGSPFQVYDQITSGTLLDMQTGATGKQYFDTFDPTDPVTALGTSMYVYTPQAINLPFYETATCLAEIGNQVLIGGTGNVLYPWDQISVTPSNLIFMPENNTSAVITVNNNVFIFTGQKGNIYITSGSSVSLVTSVPDYCAGIAGSPSTYIEPYFRWGGAMYLKGRVWFSILDQTAAKAGNCGGIWSFVPNQDGISLRLENQSSYGTYNGYAKVLLPSQQQMAIGPQYWTGWDSSISSVTYGIDFSDVITTPSAVIETDLIPTGTMLNKKTWRQVEYKLSTPLAVGESVAVAYRQNSTDAYTSVGTAVVDGTTALSGYFPVDFQNGQWLQLKVTLNPLASSSSTFVRLSQVIIR